MTACSPLAPAPPVVSCEGGPAAHTQIAAGHGAVASISAAAEDGLLRLRIGFTSDDVPPHQIYVDTDSDRGTGMWTVQSSVSASGWNLLVDVDGSLRRHTGGQDEYAWAPVPDAGLYRTVSGATVDICLPAHALDISDRVAVSVFVPDTGESLPEMFMPGAAFPAHGSGQVSAAASGTPEPLAFHYGARPWEVRDCTTPACAAALYSRFAHAVFGAGLEQPAHPGHAGTRELIRALRPRTEVWGYVSLVGGPVSASGRQGVHSVDDILSRARAWRAMGASGIFIDEADLCPPTSCGVAVDRARQNEVVSGIHRLGLAVFVNAFSAADALLPIGGEAPELGRGNLERPADMYLLENPTLAAGTPRTGLDARVTHAKLALARRMRGELGVRVAAVDTLSGPVPDDAVTSPAYRGAREAAGALDAYAFTNSLYSAPPELARNLLLP